MIYLLDTNHCSRIIDNDPQILGNIQENYDADIGISVITRGELIFMAEKSQQQEENYQKVSKFVDSITLYMIDDAIADCYGKLKAQILRHFGPKDRQRRSKETIQKLGFSDNDLWIAATAIIYSMTVVSADSDFVRIQEVQHLLLKNWLQ